MLHALFLTGLILSKTSVLHMHARSANILVPPIGRQSVRDATPTARFDESGMAPEDADSKKQN